MSTQNAAVSNGVLTISLTPQVGAPSNGTIGLLILQSSKNGEVIFRDAGEVFTSK